MNMVGIAIFATRRYKEFVYQLLDSIDEYLLLNHYLQVVLFTDDPEYFHTRYTKDRIFYSIVEIPSLKFPQATLHRYHYITKHRKEFMDCTHTFYIDADMSLIAPVGEEILGEGLTAVYHPGFFKREKYYAGGFQGGTTLTYLVAAQIMSDQISKDELRGWKPEHNDEWYWNEYLKGTEFLELDQGYCMVEEPHLRKAWGIDHFEPKILALKKDHKLMRA
jgi:hypothetical protein